jgi:DNA invertase Pin-like site-specific DNA recombinase
VSTIRQDHQSQIDQITQYLHDQQLPPPIWYKDTLTGASPWQNRELKNILKEAEKADVIIVTEITRIERTLHGILEFAHEAGKRELEIHIVKSGLILNNSLNSRITLAMLGLAGEIEREMNNARALAGVQTRREKGLPLGRPQGTQVKLKLDAWKNDIPKWRAKKLSMHAIAKLTDSSVPTVKRWLERQKSKVLIA